MNVTLLFRVDIGFDPERGYAAVVQRGYDGARKGIKGNSIRQLLRRINEEVVKEEHNRYNFPMESEPRRIITPNGFDG